MKKLTAPAIKGALIGRKISELHDILLHELGILHEENPKSKFLSIFYLDSNKTRVKKITVFVSATDSHIRKIICSY